MNPYDLGHARLYVYESDSIEGRPYYFEQNYIDPSKVEGLYQGRRKRGPWVLAPFQICGEAFNEKLKVAFSNKNLLFWFQQPILR